MPEIQPVGTDTINVTNIYPKSPATTITFHAPILVDEIQERDPAAGVKVLSTLKVDAIDELTGAAGVTINGCIKVTSADVIPSIASVDLGASTSASTHFLAAYIIGLKSSGQALTIGTLSAHAINISVNSLTRWSFASDGDIEQNATNGGNIVFAKSGTGVINTVVSTATAAGTNSSGATTILSTITNFSTVTASARGGRFSSAIQPGKTYYVSNSDSADGLWVYTPSGATYQDGSSVVVLSSGQSGIFVCISATQWAFTKSA